MMSTTWCNQCASTEDLQGLGDIGGGISLKDMFVISTYVAVEYIFHKAATGPVPRMYIMV